MTTTVILADYQNPKHQQDIPIMMQAYATDPMGGGTPIAESVLAGLVEKLAQLPYAFSVLAYQGDDVVGLANCFEGFSTFQAKPLINIHDLVVANGHRGQGVGQALLQAVENIAQEKGCCKITLEVLSNNEIAQGAYQKFGFAGYQLSETGGQALFWQKSLATVS
ncbi:GNAT family N-acetyltransferase [Halioxenophilus aromaticivorans]|uniref:GNAT family N-acetyltransferase n=1 Tax=Halioxenophilus aromaticivorans TaxID=1306992 RepID=A0AAV3U452_9ALTE